MPSFNSGKHHHNMHQKHIVTSIDRAYHSQELQRAKGELVQASKDAQKGATDNSSVYNFAKKKKKRGGRYVGIRWTTGFMTAGFAGLSMAGLAYGAFMMTGTIAPLFPFAGIALVSVGAIFAVAALGLGLKEAILSSREFNHTKELEAAIKKSVFERLFPKAMVELQGLTKEEREAFFPKELQEEIHKAARKIITKNFSALDIILGGSKSTGTVKQLCALVRNPFAHQKGVLPAVAREALGYTGAIAEACNDRMERVPDAIKDRTDYRERFFQEEQKSMDRMGILTAPSAPQYHHYDPLYGSDDYKRPLYQQQQFYDGDNSLPYRTSHISYDDPFSSEYCDPPPLYPEYSSSPYPDEQRSWSNRIANENERPLPGKAMIK